MARKIIRLLIFLAALALLLFSGYQIARYLLENRARDNVTKDMISRFVRPAPSAPVEETGPQEETQAPRVQASISVDFAALQAEHPDIIAWLYGENTPIHNPVVQAQDNEYYLRRLLDGSWNTAGTLFLDYRNASDFSDGRSMIYGHSMKDGSMFGSLLEYRDPAYYQAHPALYLLTPEGDYRVEFVAGYEVDDDSLLYTLPDSASEREALISYAAEHSAFDSGVEVTPEDRLLVLSTCAYDFEGARFVLLGVLRG